MYKQESKFFEIENNYETNQILVKFNFQERLRFGSVIKIHKSPTDNCQLCIIGGIESFLTLPLDAKRRPIAFKQLVRLISYYVGKRIVLIDVHQRDSQAFIDLFAPFGEVLTRTPYDSTNRSQMEILMFKLNPNLRIRKY